MFLPASVKLQRMHSAVVIVLLSALLAPVLLAQKPAAQPGEKPAAAGEKKPRRALPAYYASLVTEDQRAKIYAVQDKYDAQIAALAEQIKALQKDRDTEIEGVLSPEQKKLLEKARADAKAKAAAKATARQASEEKPKDE